MQSEPAKPTTPMTTSMADLSPPSSQGVPLPDTSAGNLPTPGANANGKRPISLLDTNGEAPPPLRLGQSNNVPAQVKTHASSGYTWSKAEDEPGWAWKNRRAVEEANRAWEGLLMKDLAIGSECLRSDTCVGGDANDHGIDRYGDPFEVAEREAILLRSQEQR